MTIIKSQENYPFGPPPPALFAAIGALGAEASQKGVMVDMGGLLPSSKGALLRITKRKLTITDGPFTEAKEVFGGYAVYDVKDKEEALYWAKRFMMLHLEHWPEWEGACEVLPYMEGPPPSMG